MGAKSGGLRKAKKRFAIPPFEELLEEEKKKEHPPEEEEKKDEDDDWEDDMEGVIHQDEAAQARHTKSK